MPAALQLHSTQTSFLLHIRPTHAVTHAWRYASTGGQGVPTRMQINKPTCTDRVHAHARTGQGCAIQRYAWHNSTTAQQQHARAALAQMPLGCTTRELTQTRSIGPAVVAVTYNAITADVVSLILCCCKGGASLYFVSSLRMPEASDR
jgi:hypothetical protein